MDKIYLKEDDFIYANYVRMTYDGRRIKQTTDNSFKDAELFVFDEDTKKDYPVYSTAKNGRIIRYYYIEHLKEEQNEKNKKILPKP